MSETPLLEIHDLAVSFPGSEGAAQRVHAGAWVNLTIYPRQTLALVGESGSGKSVSALSTLRLIPTPPGRYDGGRILWRSSADAPTVDLLSLDEKRMRHVRGNDIAMIFQEPMTSLNPVYTIGDQILEAILLHQKVPRREAVQIAIKALNDVGIADATRRMDEYPHQLSGGMRQRVMIAMALSCQPKLLLADEPTTALDVTIQAQILELLRSLQHEHDMAVLLITHDLGVVAENADVVAVMYAGRIVEYASVFDLFERPRHPYTRGLLASIPTLGGRARRLPTVVDGATIPEDFPDQFTVRPHEPVESSGARAADPDERLHEIEPQHWVLCKHRSGDASKATRPDLPYRRPVATASPA